MFPPLLLFLALFNHHPFLAFYWISLTVTQQEKEKNLHRICPAAEKLFHKSTFFIRERDESFKGTFFVGSALLLFLNNFSSGNRAPSKFSRAESSQIWPSLNSKVKGLFFVVVQTSRAGRTRVNEAKAHFTWKIQDSAKERRGGASNYAYTNNANAM